MCRMYKKNRISLINSQFRPFPKQTLSKLTSNWSFIPGEGTLVFRGVHTLIIKFKKYPLSTDFSPEKHPYF